MTSDALEPVVTSDDRLMEKAVTAGGELVRELASLLASPASRTGLATTIMTTAILGRMRIPFPVTLFTAIVLGDAAEKAHARYLGAGKTSVRGELRHRVPGLSRNRL